MVTPGSPYTYQPFEGDGLGPQTLTPWEGAHVALLTEPPPGGGSYDPAIMTRIVNALDGAYDVYAQFTGAEPTPYVTYDGKLSIAVLPDNAQYTFAAHGYLGLTGIEIQQTYFNALYDDAQNNQYDQALFYELGRNFWFFQAQLGAADPFVTGFAIAGRFISMDVAGLAGGPFNGFPFSTFKAESLETLNADFFGSPNYTLANTLEANVAPVNTFNNGVADFAGSLLYRVYDDFGLSGYSAFYRALSNQPAAGTPADAVANFIRAASQATGIDYGFIDKPAGTAYLVGSAADDNLVATSGGPVLTYDGNDTVQGSAASDSIFGGGGADILHGNAGTDLIVGGGGSDNLDGGDGSDTLMGGDGADTLSGGSGDNRLTGGAGADLFTFQVADSAGSGNLFRNGQHPDELANAQAWERYDALAAAGGYTAAVGSYAGHTLWARPGEAGTYVATSGVDTITDFDPAQGDRLNFDGVGDRAAFLSQLAATSTPAGIDLALNGQTFLHLGTSAHFDASWIV